MSYRSSHLWQKSFAPQNDGWDDARTRLEEAYGRFWTKATALSQTISRDLPNLTLHDESHFKALWRSADLIAGPDYPMNPLEAFVFGGAILLHDAGHAVAAFANGLADIEKTPQWQDALVAALTGKDGALPDDDAMNSPPDEARKRALFDTLRLLHAERAEELGGFSISRNGERFHLIDDDQLRAHLGETIGLIAASHHWDLNELEKRLRRHCGALAGLCPLWTIDPIKLACLLRCADAVQIDQERAPDFSYALLRLPELSENHWRAQNRLSLPCADTEDSSAIIFTSTRTFGEADVDAWWLAHDAIAMADRELRGCHALLRDLQCPPFRISRIKDADSPSRLAQHVQPKGWEPVNAELRITRVDQIVATLGGKHLYGDDPKVPLRELIQNACDAVRARRALEHGYDGKVTVRLEMEGDNSFLLHVEDDGTGMSERVLTQALLDFGTSFWGSDLARREFPGLRGKRLRQTGRYGIGFFSAFMISDHIIVSTRPYNGGQGDIRSLVFRKGLALRPILLERAQPPLPMRLSTRVTLRVSAETVEKMLSISGRFGEEYRVNDRQATLAQLLGHLCPTIDCALVIMEPGHKAVTQEAFDWHPGNPEAWLRRALLADLREDKAFDSILAEASRRLRIIGCPDRPLGLAAISLADIGTGFKAVGGFIGKTDGGRLHQLARTFVGCIGAHPGGARRNSGAPLAAGEELARWATDQAAIIAKSDASLWEKYWASIHIAQWGGTSTEIACFEANYRILSLKEIIQKAKNGSPFFAKINRREECQYIGPVRVEVGYISLGVGGHNSVIDADVLTPYISTDLEGSPYFKIDHPHSIIGLIVRCAAEQGYDLVQDVLDDFVFGTYTGPSNELGGFTTGMEIRGTALRLSLKPRSAAG